MSRAAVTFTSSLILASGFLVATLSQGQCHNGSREWPGPVSDCCGSGSAQTFICLGGGTNGIGCEVVLDGSLCPGFCEVFSAKLCDPLDSTAVRRVEFSPTHLASNSLVFSQHRPNCDPAAFKRWLHAESAHKARHQQAFSSSQSTGGK